MAVTLRQFVNDLDQVTQQASVQMSLSIAKGSIKDMEEYNRAVGRIQGMEQAVKLARDMLAKMDEINQKGDLPEMPDAGAAG